MNTITVRVTVTTPQGKTIYDETRSAPRSGDRGGQAELLANHAGTMVGEGYAWPENDALRDPSKFKRTNDIPNELRRSLNP